MSTKKFTGAGLAIGAATAVTAMLLGTTAAYAGSDGTESAFGISASGLLDIPETPFVESEDGDFVEDEFLGLDEGILKVGVLNVTAQDGAADSEVVDLELRGILSAKVIRTSCFDGDGGLEIVDLKVAGDSESLLRIPQEGLIKNEEIDLTPLVRLTLGEQTRNSDDTITVTGIKVEVLPVTESQLATPVLPAEADLLGDVLGTDLQLDDTPILGEVLDQLDLGTDEPLQTVTIGSATCDEISDGKKDDDKKDDVAKDDHCDDGTKDDDESADKDVTKDDSSCDDGSSDDDDDDDSDDTGTAPAPTVVQASLPVTG